MSDDKGYPGRKVKLGTETVVFDLDENRVILRLDGVVVLPVGSQIELTHPNVNAVVRRVRLLADVPECDEPAFVCLDVAVPRER